MSGPGGRGRSRSVAGQEAEMRPFAGRSGCAAPLICAEQGLRRPKLRLGGASNRRISGGFTAALHEPVSAELALAPRRSQGGATALWGFGARLWAARNIEDEDLMNFHIPAVSAAVLVA